MYARIWYEPDGHVRITSFAHGIPEVDALAACKHLIVDGHISPDATFDDVETEEELKALLPPDRSARHKWRKAPGCRGCIVDNTVPDKPNPKQAMLDAIDSAKSLDDLKAVLKASL